MRKDESTYTPDVLDEEADQRAFGQRRARQIRLTRTSDLSNRFRRVTDLRDDLSSGATCATVPESALFKLDARVRKTTPNAPFPTTTTSLPVRLYSFGHCAV